MNIENYKVTPALLNELIQKEQHSIKLFENLIPLICDDHKTFISEIIKEEQEIINTLTSLYQSFTGQNPNLLRSLKPFNDLGSVLTEGIQSELNMFSLYSRIVNDENNHLLKTYFVNMPVYKTKQAIMLNTLYSDYRGCHCHEKKKIEEDCCGNCHRHMENDVPSSTKDLMTLYWEQHVWWTRNLVLSIIDELQDEEAVTARLLQNPADIASLFKDTYGDDAANAVKELITEHLVIGRDLIRAVKKNDKQLASTLEKKWYKNADDIAKGLHSINPNVYDENKWRALLYSHLDMTKKEVEYRLLKKYKDDVQNFNMIEQEALTMANEMTKGLM